MLPNDLPPSSTVYSYFRLFQKKGVWQLINRQLRQRVRKGFDTVDQLNKRDVKANKILGGLRYLQYFKLQY